MSPSNALLVLLLRPIPGFSFSGEVREPFPAVIRALEETKVPVTSVDAPSSWDIENGPPKSGPGSKFNPAVLVSLTAPKPLVKYFNGRHFLGGRYVCSLFKGPGSEMWLA
jgi:NAD(P)H-hydrate epimerase